MENNETLNIKPITVKCSTNLDVINALNISAVGEIDKLIAVILTNPNIKVSKDCLYLELKNYYVFRDFSKIVEKTDYFLLDDSYKSSKKVAELLKSFNVDFTSDAKGNPSYVREDKSGEVIEEYIEDDVRVNKKIVYVTLKYLTLDSYIKQLAKTMFYEVDVTPEIIKYENMSKIKSTKKVNDFSNYFITNIHKNPERASRYKAFKVRELESKINFRAMGFRNFGDFYTRPLTNGLIFYGDSVVGILCKDDLTVFKVLYDKSRKANSDESLSDKAIIKSFYVGLLNETKLKIEDKQFILSQIEASTDLRKKIIKATPKK